MRWRRRQLFHDRSRRFFADVEAKPNYLIGSTRTAQDGALLSLHQVQLGHLVQLSISGLSARARPLRVLYNSTLLFGALMR